MGVDDKVVKAFKAHDRMTVEQTLNTAIENNLKLAMVIAYDQQGGLYFSTSGVSRQEALWLVEQTKKFILDIDGK